MTLAQLHGSDPAAFYDPELIMPGRPVTLKTIADAKATLTEIETTWKKRGLR